jgi:hypothetical protein
MTSPLQERQGYAKSRAMPTDATKPISPADKRPLTPAAERALAEAAARRVKQAGQPAEASKEVSGRGGLDPTRYGDWEINGLIADF